MGISLVLVLVELAFCASRIFYEEIKWKTLSGISMLPLSTAQIAYSKIAGCLVGLVPAVAYFCLGVLIYPDNFIKALENLFGQVVGWLLIVEYVLFLHAVAFLSLFVKWGALPLTVAIFFFVHGCCLSLVVMGKPGGADGFMVGMVFFGSIGIICLQFGIAERLRSVSAQ
jgi:hypothetical protein